MTVVWWFAPVILERFRSLAPVILERSEGSGANEILRYSQNDKVWKRLPAVGVPRSLPCVKGGGTAYAVTEGL